MPRLIYGLISFSLLFTLKSHALLPEAACALALKIAKKNYTWKIGQDMGPHLEIIGALQKFLRNESLSDADTEMIKKYNLTGIIDYWKAQPKYKQKMRYWLELFLMNQTKDFKENKAAYKATMDELGRLDRSGLLTSLFVARHPIFIYYMAFLLGPYATNALYTETVSEEEAEELLKTPVPDDQIEYVFYPKHVAMRVRDQFFDVGNRKELKLDSAPLRPRLDGATFIRVQGDPGLADRVLDRVKNYPEGVHSVYNEWNSHCLSNANDLIRDETGLCVPPGIGNYPSPTEGWLKMMKLFGSAKITQIKTVAPDQKLREAHGHKTKTSWLYRTSKYSEAAPFIAELAILDLLHDSAEVNFPKEKKSP